MNNKEKSFARTLAWAIAVALCLAVMTGCASKPDVRYVSASVPRVELPADPEWEVGKLEEGMELGVVAKHWAAFRVQALCHVYALRVAAKPATMTDPGPLPTYCKPKDD